MSSKRELVDDTVPGYEGLVSPAVMKPLRSVLQDAFEAAPVMEDLVDEQVAHPGGEQR